MTLNLYSLLNSLFNPDFLGHASTHVSFATGLTFKIAPEYANPGNSALFVVLAILGFITTPISMFIIYQLRALFQAFTRKQLLMLQNAKRIRLIGFATVVAWAFSVAADFVGRSYVINSFNIPGVELTSTFVPDFFMLFLGIIVLVIAEIYRMAAEIREESDFTI